MRPKAEALGYLTARATATANTGVLHYVQDDECIGDAKESGRALLDSPPFAKCAKGRAPRVVVSVRERGVFTAWRYTLGTVFVR